MDPTKGDDSPIKPDPKVEDSQAQALDGKPDERVRWWIQQVADARGRERFWRKDAVSAVELYEGTKKKEYQYNILYSNTEILSPALYNTVPRPVVVRRFRDADPLAKVASDVVKRLLEYLCDTNEAEFPEFDLIMKQSVLEALVPGRGITRFKHEVEFGAAEVEGEERVEHETVVGESVPWDRFTHGFAKQWKHVPWVAFDHYMTREELIANFGKEVGALVELSETEKESEEGGGAERRWSKGDDGRGVKLGLVHEIWNKVTKEVLFVSPGYMGGYVKEVDDPLGITGFFPMPEPLRLFDKIKTLTPTTLYTQYEEQAKELNRLTTRINRIIGACKVRGMYDKRVQGIDRLLQQDDNALLPAENMSQIGDMANLEKAIWLMPIDKLVAVLQQLYMARQEIKSVIYEIMGISDILRGASKASETLGAQEIKDQWGSLRISRMQRKVQKHARDCFRLMAEIAVGKLSQETIAKITGLQLPTRAEKEALQASLQQLQQTMQETAQPGAPPPQPPPQLQQAMVALQQPAWEDILEILRSSLTRSYRVDIETNSTIDPEATDDKQQIVELMNAMAQMMSGFAPLVEAGALSMDVVKGILQTVVRRFRFGTEIEGYLDKITQPAPKPDPKVEAQKQQAALDMQAKQADMQIAQQKAQLDLQMAQQAAQLKQQEMSMELQFKQLEHQLKMAELQAKLSAQRQELDMKHEAARQDHEMQLEAGRAKTDSAVTMAHLKTQAAKAKPAPAGGR